MKNRLIVLKLIVIASFFVSCEKKEWVSRDVELVPVYTLSGFEGNTPLQQDVYQTKPVMIEFMTSTQLESYKMSHFQDNSTDTSLEFSYTLIMDKEVDNGIDTIHQTITMRECEVKATMDSINVGTINYIDHYRYDTVMHTDLEVVVGSAQYVDTLLTPKAIVVVEDEKYYVVE